ncbi:hypothetical protein [Streptomyces sp. NPDC026673]
MRNLTEVFLPEGGDLRYEAADVALENLAQGHPVVRYRDAPSLDGVETGA